MTDKQFFQDIWMPETRKAIAELKAEEGINGVFPRFRYLYDLLLIAEDELSARLKQYAEMLNEDYFTRAVVASPIPELEQRIKRYRQAINGLMSVYVYGKHEKITDDMIETARAYPLSSLLEISHGMARCISHEDNTASMNCKNNYAYCHACGFTGDVIAVYVQLNGSTFVEAVRAMQ